MTALSPNQIVTRLAELSRLLDAAQSEMVTADEAAVRARQRYELAYARAVLKAEAGNAEQRKAQATLATETEKLDVEVADLAVRSLKSRLSVLRDQVEIGRSLSAAVRSEWSAGGAA
jgi:uncharacterized protein YlxW (UPF0749 family)